MKYLRLRSFLFCFFLFAFHAAFSQYEFLLHKSYAERYQLIDSIFYYAYINEQDSAVTLKQLRSLERMAEKNGDDELVMEAVLLRAVYHMTGIQKNEKAVEPLLFSTIERARQDKNLQVEVRARQFLARHYELHSKYGPALDHLYRSYYLLKELDTNEFPNKKDHIYNIASAYYNFGDYDNAKKYLLEAEKYNMQATPKYKMSSVINMTNTLGLIYRNERRFDSAEYYFGMARDMAARENIDVWVGIAGGNIGISYFMQGRYDEAIPLLERDVVECFKANEIDNGINSLIKLAEISLIKKDITKAKQQMELAREKIKQARDPYKHMAALFPLMAASYAATGNTAMAYRYSDSARTIEDSIASRLNAVALARSEQKIAVEKYNAELELAKSEDKLQMVVRNSLIGGILLLGMIGGLFINRQRLKHRQEKGQMLAESRLAKTDLEYATQRLEHFTQNIQDKNQFIEKLSGEIDKLQTVKDVAEAVEINNEIVLELQKTSILTDQQWEEFKAMFEKVHHGYLNRLKEKYPGLSPAETRYMVLNKLKLSNKEMANVLGVGADAIRQYRHRLKKKLSLSEESNLQDVADIV